VIFSRADDGPDVILVDTRWFSTDYLAHQLARRGARVHAFTAPPGGRRLIFALCIPTGRMRKSRFRISGPTHSRP